MVDAAGGINIRLESFPGRGRLTVVLGNLDRIDKLAVANPHLSPIRVRSGLFGCPRDLRVSELCLSSVGDRRTAPSNRRFPALRQALVILRARSAALGLALLYLKGMAIGSLHHEPRYSSPLAPLRLQAFMELEDSSRHAGTADSSENSP